MTDINDILIFSTRTSTAERITANLAPRVKQIHRADNADDILARIDTGRPDAVLPQAVLPQAVLIDLTHGADEGLSLAHRLRRRHPGLVMPALGRRKDPDLILSALRAGMSDYLVFDQDTDDLADTLSALIDRGVNGGSAGELIAVFSLKGGQGVTTVAVNLADHLQSLTGRKVLLADLHLYRGDIAVNLNHPGGYSPFDMIRDLARMDDDLLFSSLTRHKDRFYLLGANGDGINDADGISAEDLGAMLGFLKTRFDIIVADLPADFTDKTIAALDAATRIMLVTQQTVAEMKSIQSVIRFFRDIDPGDRRLEIIINRFNKNSELSPAELANVFNCPVGATVTNDYRAVTQAADQGRTLDTVCPRKRINRDFNAFASRVCGVTPATPRQALIKAITGRINPDGRRKHETK